MVDTLDIAWFKKQFGDRIVQATDGTVFDIDMLVAIACQETGYIWSSLRERFSVERVLELCVGDTIDERSAFPRNRTELESHHRGSEMFEIARAALVDMAQHVNGYASMAAKPNKFCHGYGVFQYDLQFFKADPDYFLERRWRDFDACLAKCLQELHCALEKRGWSNRSSLSEYESAAVAITYNTGSYKAAKLLRQGYFDGKRYYGENFFALHRVIKTVASPGLSASSILEMPANSAPLAPVEPPRAKTVTHEVVVSEGVLNVRRNPVIDAKRPNNNVIATLGAGENVAVVGKMEDGWVKIEASQRGALVRGYVAVRFLKKLASLSAMLVEYPAKSHPRTGPIAAYLPQTGASSARRTVAANAHSLKEVGQPARQGDTPSQLVSSIAKIIDWLAVDNPAHIRYQPRDGLTFCNIYAHDYCHLNGVYLPRIWWNQKAIERFGRGETLAAQYGTTVDELRANDLFRWLRDFGLRFGWRQTASLEQLQTEVNLGAIGIIVARRTQDGPSGHIVPVVPETKGASARRDASGAVVAPLQSQAGTVNFRYGTGRPVWWRGEQFAESAFWLHA